MADKRAAWGIDIGQAGLKAVRLEYADASDQVTATAFDYVAHPKILSQPDADPETLVREALETFLSRNDVEGDLVSISVPGQTALARFIQLPPVESSKVPEIVKYEARQQIPFALEDVIWDYQPLGSGTVEGGFMLDAEVGLFAMKRDQVQQHLDPFLEEKVEVENVQISPLALYNFICYDQMGLSKEDPVDPDADYTIVLDMGADNTTLLVTNGQKIWLRNVPIGGNHFTRALTKELKLTFAKAEHLKCNATKSPDPRSVFQALRPVFNDYVAEIQRSIGYFSSVNKEAKIDKIVGVGNGFKLAGLQKFLQQNLQYQVDRVHSFDAVSGDAVLRAPLFQDNIMSFAVPYGLALQCLDLTRIHTSLLPPEIVTERLIRRKKPWAIAAAAALLAGVAISAMGYRNVMASVDQEKWGKAESAAKQVQQRANTFKQEYESKTTENQQLRNAGDTLVGVREDRELWPEVYKAINACIPMHDSDVVESDDPSKQRRVHITSVQVSFLDNLALWYAELTEEQKESMREDDQQTAPSGPGYLFVLDGHHHYKGSGTLYTPRKFVRDTILSNLQQWTVQQDPTLAAVPVRKIGITHPVVSYVSGTETIEVPKDGLLTAGVVGRRGAPLTGRAGAIVRRPAIGGFGGRGGGRRGDDDDLEYDGGLGGVGRRGSRPLTTGIGGGGIAAPAVGAETLPQPVTDVNPEDLVWEVPRTDFRIHFLWKPTAIDKRPEIDPAKAKATEAAAAGENAQEAEGAAGTATEPGTSQPPGEDAGEENGAAATGAAPATNPDASAPAADDDER